MEKLEKQPCPFCNKKELTLMQEEKDIPHFGKCYIFSMHCNSCNYHKADIEAEQQKDPCRYEFEISKKEDLNVRVVKSSEATVKIPQLKTKVIPGPASEGFISNVEGIFQRFRKIIESERDSTDDDEVRKKCRNLLKKMWKVELGEQTVKLIIEDPSGNSAIISEKAKVSKLNVKG